MRDRMILFRDMFDLEDCLRCLIGNSIFHGGDPAVAANWELPAEFFEKFWFLTIDFSLQRTTNHWRRMQGKNELEDGRQNYQLPTALDQERQQQHTSQQEASQQRYASSLASSDTSSVSTHHPQPTDFFSPLAFSPKSTLDDTSSCHPWDGLFSDQLQSEPFPLGEQEDYDMIMNSLINTEHL